MSKRKIFPLVALLGGVIAGGLRWGQQQTGFDEVTGLSIAGNGYAWGLLALGVVCLVVCLVASRGTVPKMPSLSVAFPSEIVDLSCMVMGCFLVIASGAWMAKEAFGVSQLDLIVSCAIALGGLGMLGIVPACRAGSEKVVDISFAMLSVAAAVVLLIVCYRQVAINPVLWDYGVEVLALAAILLALFHLVGFGVGEGKSKQFSVSATIAIVLSCAMLADGFNVGMMLYFAGNAVLLFGFLMAHCWRDEKGKHEVTV